MLKIETTDGIFLCYGKQMSQKRNYIWMKVIWYILYISSMFYFPERDM